MFATLLVPLLVAQVPTDVPAQPLLAQVARLAKALDAAGQPLPPETAKALAALKAADKDAVGKVQSALDPLCLAVVEVGEKGVTKVTPVLKSPQLVEQGWRTFVVKVVNPKGKTGKLSYDSPSAKPVPKGPKAEVESRWMSLAPNTAQPLLADLSGLEVEYVLLGVYSRDAGKKSADITVSLGKDGSAMATFAFDAKPSVVVTFAVAEFDGTACTAAFLIRDKAGRVYPAQAKRLAPDFFFHPQVYRATGETVRLPAGEYSVVCSRGPESVPETKTLTVADKPVTFRYTVKRWIDPSKRSWWSGDHHIHAAGCAHYENPTEGVEPIDMMRHVLGEDLKVGCCLTWGPCFDYQKRFFTGKPDAVSKPPYLLRYDVEVSGFGSHQSGHLNLLNLTEQIHPGGLSKHHWPTLGLNTLRWAKKQGAITGPAHSANGLTRIVGRVPEAKDGPGRLPNYGIPAYDGIGANEFVMNVPHTVPGPDGKPVPAVDFISTMDTDRVAEFNMWYHVLNCGYRVRASGETDFPCISGERVGMGRVYAKVDGPITWDKWVRGLADGRSYVSDGTTHLMDFVATANDKTLGVGESGSEIRLEKPGKVTFAVKAASRVTGKKTVDVELVVNGRSVETKAIPADGKVADVTFTAEVTKSSWVAVRVMPSAHANPFFVVVGGKPIRADKYSAQWCLMGVDQCWKTKEKTYRKEEMEQARKDYDAARAAYRKILAECE